jgi:hypothetical protein
MLSKSLVELIESNWELIADRLIAAVRKHPEMPRLSKCSDVELRQWCREILSNLGQLLAYSTEEEVKRRFHLSGRLRYEESVPLHEAVLRLHMLKEKIIGFVHEQGFPMTAMHLYVEEDLELRMGRFFDACVYQLVRGYEDAMRVAARAS